MPNVPAEAYRPEQDHGAKLDEIAHHAKTTRFYVGLLLLLFVAAAIAVLFGIVKLQVEIQDS